MLHRLIPLGFALFLPVAAAASALGDKQLGAEPVGPVILTVSGNIERVGSNSVVRLDRAMLEVARHDHAQDDHGLDQRGSRV